jgi:DNA-binding SARP family transcriptional activator/class 3 adenylate cyclase
MPPFQLSLFGGFSLLGPDGAPVHLPAKKARALLAYLARRPGVAHSRDKLAVLLWEEVGEIQARTSLRQALAVLRRTAKAVGEHLETRPDSVTFSPPTEAVDVSCFERALAEGSVVALQRAAVLYQGDLLDGLNVQAPAFDDWLNTERQYLRERALDGLGRLLNHHLASDNTDQGLLTALRLIALDPLREAARRAIMALYARTGRHALALRHYRDFCDLLHRDLDVTPEPETAALYQEILQQRRRRRERAAPQAELVIGRAPGPPEPTELPERSNPPANLEAPEATPSTTSPHLPERVSGVERRQVTVLVCDLVGSAALAAGLDPEDLHELLRQYRDTVVGNIAKLDGQAGRLLGNAIMACFGWPKAHEDAAERAVRAGLAIVGAVSQLGAAEGRLLAVRVGIATGLVVAGDPAQEGMPPGQSVTGQTPTLAAHLQALAAPGTVVVADATRRLLGSLFELAELGEPEIEGADGPVSVWRVVTERVIDSRFEARYEPRLAPLMGRDEELALLRRRWALARSGEGQAVLLVGEAGIGKSRIAHSLLETVGAEAHRCLRFQSSPHHLDSMLWPVAQHLARTGGIAVGDDEATRIGKLERLLAGTVEDGAEAVRLLAELVGAGQAVTADQTPQQRRDRMLRFLTQYWVGTAARGPVLALVEDAHWLDPTTLELLGQLVGQIAGVPLLLLITSRPERMPVLVGLPDITRLTLNRLGRSDARAIVDSLTAGRPLGCDLCEQIVARTDGMPLYVEELTKLILERGPSAVSALAIPASLQDLLMARLERLEAAREVAQAAACIGREFSRDLLADILGLPDRPFEAALERLSAAELIFRRGAGPDPIYSFKHALVRDAAYGTLLKGRRREIHGRIAGALERAHAAGASIGPELIAFHLRHAALPDEAIPYFIQAVEQALGRAAGGEALTLVQSGLEAAETITDPAVRDRAQARLHLLRGQCLRALSGTAAPQTAAAYCAAGEAFMRVNDCQGYVTALYGEFLSHFIGRLAAADHTAGLLLAASSAQARDLSRLLALDAVGMVRFAQGRFAEACEHFAPTLAFPDRFAEDAQGTGLVAPLLYYAGSLFLAGHADQARDLDRRIIDHARRAGKMFALVATLGNACYILKVCGDVEALSVRSAEVVELARQGQLPILENIGLTFHGWILTRQGDGDRGQAIIRDAVTVLETAGHRTGVPFQLSLLSEAYAFAGRWAEAGQQLDRCLALAEAHGVHWPEAELHRQRAAVILGHDASHAVAAEQALQRALAIARKQGARHWELCAARDLARLWAARGERHRALDLLTPIYGWFSEGLDMPDLEQAKAVLDALR